MLCSKIENNTKLDPVKMETYGVSKRSSITSASKPDYAPASYIPKVPNSQAFNRSFNQTVNQTGRNPSRFFMTGGRAETSTPSISNQRWQQRAEVNNVHSQVRQGVHNHVTGQKTSWGSRIEHEFWNGIDDINNVGHMSEMLLEDMGVNAYDAVVSYEKTLYTGRGNLASIASTAGLVNHMLHAVTTETPLTYLEHEASGIKTTLVNEAHAFVNETTRQRINTVAKIADIGLFAAITKGIGLDGVVEDIGVESSLSSEAVNHISGLRLQRLLTIDQARSIFTETGELTPEVISKSDVIIQGEDLNNPNLIQDLTRFGDEISDWAKYKTKSTSSPSGSFQMHFYKNSVSGEVYYGADYKAVFNHQGSWNFSPQPKFSYEPPQFNPY